MTTAITDERLAELREWLGKLHEKGYSPSVIADLLSVLDEHAALKSENERLKRDTIDLAKQTAGDAIKKIKARAEKAEALVEVLSAAIPYGWKDRAEKAGAENERLQNELDHAYELWNGVIEDYNQAEAELAEVKPLIEAAEYYQRAEAGHYTESYTMSRPVSQSEMNVLREALALRQKKEAK